LKGDGVRALLQSGAAIDLHPTAFGIGAAAATAICHINVLLWCAIETDSFEIACHRSYGESLQHWMTVTAAGL
jgi:sarcosine oxidase subunit gamma